MWREEAGLVEMLLSYLGERQHFSGWANWRLLLVDILSCHEAAQRRDGLDTREEEEEPCVGQSGTGHLMWPEVDPAMEETGGEVRMKVETPDEEEPWTNVWEESSSVPAPKFSDTVKEEEESACVPVPAHGWLQLPVATGGSQREEDEAAPTRASGVGRRLARDPPRARRSGRRATRTDDWVASGTCEDAAAESCTDAEAGGSSTSRSREAVTHARQTVGDVEGLACPGTSAQGVDDSMDGNSSVHQGESFPCSRCSKTFSDPDLRNAHERTHRGMIHKCSYCPKVFNVKGHKICHERKHTGEKPFECSYCSKTFSMQSNLKTHERIHTGERPYKCSYCPKNFHTKGDQTRHERQHSGVKPYKCSYCDRLFTNVGNKNIHERLHSGVKPYTCSYCPKAFINGSQRRIHERKHEENKQVKRFYVASAHQGNAVTVQAEPTPEKPYKCSFCSKTFSHKGNRTVHEQQRHGGIPVSYNFEGYPQWTPKIRTPVIGEKPFKCFFCPEVFREKQEKMMHERIHYQDNS